MTYMFRYDPNKPTNEEVIRHTYYIVQTIENHIELSKEDQDRLVEDMILLRENIEKI